MLFCKANGLIYNPKVNRQGIPIKQIVTIYKKFSGFNKLMDYDEFKRSIDYLAVKFYEVREDKRDNLKV